jgi:hypothetical protein
MVEACPVFAEQTPAIRSLEKRREDLYMITCKKCNDSGSFMENGCCTICLCPRGVELLKEIQAGRECPACDNTGYKNPYSSAPKTFCTCIHGRDAKHKT